MAGKRKGLGTGLDALLSGEARRNPVSKTLGKDSGKAADGSDAGAGAEPSLTGLKELPVDLLERGEMQPRVDMRPEALQELADSIRSQGIAQPILVRPAEGGKYEIVAGERRWRAAQLAGLTKVPAVVRDLDDTQARASVSNLMRLMELELDVQKMLESRDLEMGHARALLGLSGRQQIRAAREVVAGSLSVRATERMVQTLTKPKKPKKTPSTADNDVRRLENQLSEKLGARVSFQQGTGGKGKLTISYNSLEELDGILAHIK